MTNDVIPFVFTPINQVHGFVLSIASNTTLTIGNGQAIHSDNNFLFNLPSTVTLNAAVNGINGLDTGSLANSTFYYLHVIANQYDPDGVDFPVGMILSTSASAPVLPANYNKVYRVGWVKTDGSAHFLKMNQTGIYHERNYEWDAPISVLSGGTATTQTAVSLAAAVPPLQNTLVDLQVAFKPNAAEDAATLYPTGSSGSGNRLVTGVVAAKTQDLVLSNVTANLASSVPKIDYKVAASGNLSLSVISSKDFI